MASDTHGWARNDSLRRHGRRTLRPRLASSQRSGCLPPAQPLKRHCCARLPYRAQRDDLQHTHIRTSRSPTPSGGTRCRGLWRGASGAWNVPPAIVGRAPSIWAARTAKRCDEGTIWEGDHTRSLDSRMRPPPVPQHRESTKGCKLLYGGARVAKRNLPMQHHDVAMAHGATRPSP